MTAHVKLSELEDVVEAMEYPLDRDDVLDAHGDLRILLADGEVTVRDVLADSTTQRFENATDLASELFAFLPREAVGEPYQSEGEG